MHQLVKGGKWIFGWAIVGPNGEIPIPPEAFSEYAYQFGETILFFKGSQTSGGFSMGRPERIAQSKIDLQMRAIGEGVIDQFRQVIQPPDLGLKPGDRLLVGRGSGLALGFWQRGPIYQEALQHSEVQIFSIDSFQRRSNPE
jgi:hypothetical protein